ncbi:hypothetical protein ACS77_22935 [Pseudomonas syringae]|jgi:antitoxin component of MazEF toxin-antitoxin module|uniref:SpoVT-AbrB domain-containing protein n=1 Tax=Pseudomonas syringae TaxID=317 RepID=A0A0L1M094_PSESX|nr:hypothetical protein ACS77_22935 [Pseudomonas syringae]
MVRVIIVCPHEYVTDDIPVVQADPNPHVCIFRVFSRKYNANCWAGMLFLERDSPAQPKILERLIKMITMIRRVGNSAGVVIPSIILKEVQLNVGTEIEMIADNGILTIKPLKPRRIGRREFDLAWLLEDFEDIFDDQLPGPRVGAEIIRDDYDTTHHPRST